MKKRREIDGEVVRRERVKRAWTQEQLSERSQLAVRTLRRLEAGKGSLESLRRVAEALELEPASALASEPEPTRLTIAFEPARLEFSSALLREAPESFVTKMIERIVTVRRHLALELGFLLPPVRFCDFVADTGTYRIRIREMVVAQGEVKPAGLLAVASRLEQLKGLRGPVGSDPTFGNPAVWVDEDEGASARSQGCLIFSSIDVIATHFTHLARRHASRFLGIEAVSGLLDGLRLPRLVAEVIPSKVSLVTLRAVLRDLLAEEVSIRDLEQVLETLADHATPESCARDLVELVRLGLRDAICQECSDGEENLVAYTFIPEWEERAVLDPSMISQLVMPAPTHALVTSSALRRALRDRFPQMTVLSRDELAGLYHLISLAELPN